MRLIVSEQSREGAVPRGPAHLSRHSVGLGLASPVAAIKKSIGNSKLQFSIEGGITSSATDQGHAGQIVIEGMMESHLPLTMKSAN